MMAMYQLLLRLCPKSFRLQYGDEMAAIFARRLRDTPGVFGRVLLWIEALFDVALTAAQTHGDLLRQDLRYTFRSLRRSPGFTGTVVLVAAIGIGATTAAFSLADYILFRPLPFPDADRLVRLWEDQSPYSYQQMEPSPANYRDWKRMGRSFTKMAAYHTGSMNMVGVGDPEQIEYTEVSADLLPILGAQAAMGRVFTTEDDRTGAPGTALLSYGFWQERFGGDAGVLGRKVVLDGEPFVIIGVMGREFYFPQRTSRIWTALRFTKDNFVDRTDNWLHVLGKLKPGVTLEQAREEMRAVAAELRREYPKENEHVGITTESLRQAMNERSPQMLLYVLLGASVCVLLIACTNVANLLLARALVRRKELAVRAAMGAGRERLIRQMLTESAVLALGGGAAGVGLAFAILPFLGRLVPEALPVAQTPSIDGRVLIFSLLISLATAVGFGTVPALRTGADIIAAALGEGSRGGVGGRRERLRSALVLAEIAVSVVLLISAGLLMRALLKVQEVDPGFRSQGVLTMRTTLPMTKYGKAAARFAFYRKVLTEVGRLPGVSGAAYTSFLPMAFRGGVWQVTIPGQLAQPGGHRLASARFITPGYLTLMGTPLLGGRDVGETDTLTKPMAAVVSASFVRQYWPHENPMGKVFHFADADRTVVGVVGDVRVRGLERSSEPQVYLPYRQQPDDSYIFYTPKDLVVRVTGKPDLLMPAIQRIIHNADPQQPIADVQMLSEIVEAETGSRLTQIRILGAFAAIALVLAGVGMHGLLSFVVASRSQEIGVRMAMGAQAGDILGMVLRQSVALVGAGATLGVVLAYGAGRAIQSLLAGVAPADGAAFSGGIALVIATALAGSLVPALRAVRVNPINVIRAER